MTVCVDLSGPTGSLGFELDGEYQGVAFPLPKSRDRDGRPLPLMPHLLLRNIAVAADFAGEPARAGLPGSPINSFRPWRVRLPLNKHTHARRCTGIVTNVFGG